MVRWLRTLFAQFPAPMLTSSRTLEPGIKYPLLASKDTELPQRQT